MKPKRMYAIIENDKLATFDYRAPLYWLRKLAVRDAKERCLNYKIVPVEVKITK